MTVAELIAKLQAMPQHLPVCLVYDGAARCDVSNVWLSRMLDVLLSGPGEPVYNEEERPADAPLAEDEPNWRTPGKEC